MNHICRWHENVSGKPKGKKKNETITRDNNPARLQTVR